MAKALVKSPGRKAAARTTGTRARTKPKTKPTKTSSSAKAQPKKASKLKPPSKEGAKAKAAARPSKVTKKGKAAAREAPASKRGAAAEPRGAETTRKPGDPRGKLKERFAKLSQAKSQISGLKRSIHKSFFDVGVILNQIRDERLYEVKGYGSFESFVEREIDLNKALCLRSARIAVAITRDEAEAAGLERSSAAVAALDGEEPQAAGFRPVGSPVGTIPVHKR